MSTLCCAKDRSIYRHPGDNLLRKSLPIGSLVAYDPCPALGVDRARAAYDVYAYIRLLSMKLSIITSLYRSEPYIRNSIAESDRSPRRSPPITRSFTSAMARQTVCWRSRFASRRKMIKLWSSICLEMSKLLRSTRGSGSSPRTMRRRSVFRACRGLVRSPPRRSRPLRHRWRPSSEDATLLPGSVWFRGNTRPAASRGWAVRQRWGSVTSVAC
jgi:hypothetical protein